MFVRMDGRCSLSKSSQRKECGSAWKTHSEKRGRLVAKDRNDRVKEECNERGVDRTTHSCHALDLIIHGHARC